MSSRPEASDPLSDNDPLLSWEEAAAALGCSVRTLQRLKRERQIGWEPIGASSRPRIKFRQSHVTNYRRSREQAAAVGMENSSVSADGWAWIEEQVAKAPPLTEQQVRALAAIFSGDPAGSSQRTA